MTLLQGINLDKLPPWLRHAVASTGGMGLFLVAFLDSSFLTFPVINDLLVVELSLRTPAKMMYYALMTTLGSVAGCVVLYFFAEKGGEVYFHRHAGQHRAERIRAWMNHNGFLSVLVAALLPPPTPFKLFVLAAGVFEVPVRQFVLALVVARSLRYFGEGFLAVKYGPLALQLLRQHKVAAAFAGVFGTLAFYFLMRLALRKLHLIH